MPEIVVAAQPRSETGKNANRRLRVQGLIPAVLYGTAKEARPVAVSPKDIGGILKSASGENTLFDVELEGSRRKVILKEFQIEPLKGELLHADMYEVALDKPIEVSVHVELHGTPVGVKVEGGILDFITRELDVECLPTDIPDKIVLDVSELGLGKHLRVSDIAVPPRVTILTESEVVVVHVVAKRAEEEAAPVAAEPTAVEGEKPEEAAAKKEED